MLILLYSSYVVPLAGDFSLLTMADGYLWQVPNGQQHFMQDERSHFTQDLTSQFISPMEDNARSHAHPIRSGSRPKPRPVFGVCSSASSLCT